MVLFKLIFLKNNIPCLIFKLQRLLEITFQKLDKKTMFNKLFKKLVQRKQRKIVFKISYYNLNINDRKVKYQDYDVILCGKCKQQFDDYWFYCKYCYFNENNNKEERNHMIFGRCKKCFQACANQSRCSACGFQSNFKNIAFF